MHYVSYNISAAGKIYSPDRSIPRPLNPPLQLQSQPKIQRKLKTSESPYDSPSALQTLPSTYPNSIKQTIFSDAILAMLKAPTPIVNGLLELDEDFLRKNLGIEDFSKYSVVEGATPRRIMPRRFPDLRVDEHDDEGKRVDSAELRKEKL